MPDSIEKPLETTPATHAMSGKYLSFILDGEEFGLEILKVQEIIGVMKVTRVPKSPHYVRGVINLRGKVIPVLDLRLKFGMTGVKDTERTCIIVTEVRQNGIRITMGAIVDEVSEVLTVSESQIEPPPLIGSLVDTAFLIGMGKIGKKVVMLLDIEKVLVALDVKIAA